MESVASHPRPAVRHPAFVRIAHWLTAFAVLALVISGIELIISHPRFYWGETGNVLTPALFQLPIPASRRSVPTGYGFVLPDQNGWSRDLHFQAAWVLVITGLAYVIVGLYTRHFRSQLLLSGSDLKWQALSRNLKRHAQFGRPDASEAWSYNSLQRLAYLFVLFGLCPLIVWSGLAMSPAVVSAFPFLVDLLGGHQSARTIHFFCFLLLSLFVLVHVVMIFRAGFWNRTLAMLTGRAAPPKEP